MNIIVLDTETISVTKAYCYNLGYVIADVSNNFKVLKKRDYLVGEIYNNNPLFDTAYYAYKRPIYEKRLNDKNNCLHLGTWKEIYTILKMDCTHYNVKGIYAYNSKFDEKVLRFNCGYFKIPYTLVPLHDIMYYAKSTIANDYRYKLYTTYHANTNNCVNHDKLVRKNGKPKLTAESVYCYISKDYTFKEEHTALNDSEIELEILKYLYRNYGLTLNR